jgi:hypothetical protein
MSYDENNDLVGGGDEFGADEKEPVFGADEKEPDLLDDLDLVDDSDDAFRFPGEDEEETY